MFDWIFNVPSFLGGGVVGVVVMFFIAQNNPEWISKTYRTLKVEFDEKKEKLEKLEFAKAVKEEVERALAKIKQ
jgi:hypothetical protein